MLQNLKKLLLDVFGSETCIVMIKLGTEFVGRFNASHIMESLRWDMLHKTNMKVYNPTLHSYKDSTCCRMPKVCC